MNGHYNAPDGSFSAAGAVPKVCGADVELGNAVLGAYGKNGTGREASRLLLHFIDGVPGSVYSSSYSRGSDYSDTDSYGTYGGSAASRPDPQDWGRKYLPGNGGCAYIDLDHLELCIPEVTSARDFVAAWHAMLRIARASQRRANQSLPAGMRIQVLVNNSDGLGHSYGSHLNLLVSRRAWSNIFDRRMHHMLYLAAFQVSSIVVTGQGKVGSENARPPVAFQISQRADFFEELCAPHTTYSRPIVNSRDEGLVGPRSYPCREDGPSDTLARLHCIFFDNTLCHSATFLKAGLMQIVLAMIEHEQINLDLLLDDPVEAVTTYSHDPSLAATARMASGRVRSALELQFEFLERAERFVAQGGCEGVVPEARAIVDLWADTLVRLERRDWETLCRRLDWVLKRCALERALEQHGGLSWDSAEAKLLDHVYSSLEADGLYWIYEQAGAVDRLAGEERIAHLVRNPPDDTRAYARAMLLRSVEADAVDSVDWDCVRLRVPGANGWRKTETIRLAHPLGMTKEETEHVFEQPGDPVELVRELKRIGERYTA